jgi:hypothetical protein
LVIKFPQWYDRFHLFGYDPARFCPLFDQVWVGTEVRNPKTRRMGYVQPTEGYMNFRWLSSVSPKTTGAWFDHIECTPENFIDQAFMSVLAGAKELTLFHLSDLIEGHPGDALLSRRLTELGSLAAKIEAKQHRGIAFYKPSGSDAGDNMYLADYLGMVGLPLLPVAAYPTNAEVVFLPAQAAADPRILAKIRSTLDLGKTVVMTPAFIRSAGGEAARLAGTLVSATSAPQQVSSLNLGTERVMLASPLQTDGGVQVADAKSCISAVTKENTVPVLTTRKHGPGRVLVLNVRTFSEADFRASDEWLLAPVPLGLSELPPEVSGVIRQEIAGPMSLSFEGPSGIACVAFNRARCFYNFHDAPVVVKAKGGSFSVRGHDWVWSEQ